jgi:hypothetical protein
MAFFGGLQSLGTGRRLAEQRMESRVALKIMNEQNKPVGQMVAPGVLGATLLGSPERAPARYLMPCRSQIHDRRPQPSSGRRRHPGECDRTV